MTLPAVPETGIHQLMVGVNGFPTLVAALSPTLGVVMTGANNYEAFACRFDGKDVTAIGPLVTVGYYWLSWAAIAPLDETHALAITTDYMSSGYYPGGDPSYVPLGPGFIPDPTPTNLYLADLVGRVLTVDPATLDVTVGPPQLLLPGSYVPPTAPTAITFVGQAQGTSSIAVPAGMQRGDIGVIAYGTAGPIPPDVPTFDGGQRLAIQWLGGSLGTPYGFTQSASGQATIGSGYIAFQGTEHTIELPDSGGYPAFGLLMVFRGGDGLVPQGASGGGTSSGAGSENVWASDNFDFTTPGFFVEISYSDFPTPLVPNGGDHVIATTPDGLGEVMAFSMAATYAAGSPVTFPAAGVSWSDAGASGSLESQAAAIRLGPAFDGVQTGYSDDSDSSFACVRAGKDPYGRVILHIAGMREEYNNAGHDGYPRWSKPFAYPFWKLTNVPHIAALRWDPAHPDLIARGDPVACAPGNDTLACGPHGVYGELNFGSWVGWGVNPTDVSHGQFVYQSSGFFEKMLPAVGSVVTDSETEAGMICPYAVDIGTLVVTPGTRFKYHPTTFTVSALPSGDNVGQVILTDSQFYQAQTALSDSRVLIHRESQGDDPNAYFALLGFDRGTGLYSVLADTVTLLPDANRNGGGQVWLQAVSSTVAMIGYVPNDYHDQPFRVAYIDISGDTLAVGPYLWVDPGNPTDPWSWMFEGNLSPVDLKSRYGDGLFMGATENARGFGGNSGTLVFLVGHPPRKLTAKAGPGRLFKQANV